MVLFGRRVTLATWALLAVAVVCVVAGVIYLTTAANHLPSFLPGHIATRISHKTGRALHYGKYTKRAIAAFVVAVLALIGAWFTTKSAHRRHR